MRFMSWVELATLVGSLVLLAGYLVVAVRFAEGPQE